MNERCARYKHCTAHPAIFENDISSRPPLRRLFNALDFVMCVYPRVYLDTRIAHERARIKARCARVLCHDRPDKLLLCRELLSFSAVHTKSTDIAVYNIYKTFCTDAINIDLRASVYTHTSCSSQEARD